MARSCRLQRPAKERCNSRPHARALRALPSLTRWASTKAAVVAFAPREEYLLGSRRTSSKTLHVRAVLVVFVRCVQETDECCCAGTTDGKSRGGGGVLVDLPFGSRKPDAVAAGAGRAKASTASQPSQPARTTRHNKQCVSYCRCLLVGRGSCMLTCPLRFQETLRCLP